jgi:hypothetical protein
MGCSSFLLKEDNPNQGKKENKISFRCTYEIKNYNEIQILNYRGLNEINEEIKTKIKILNLDKIEELIFIKKFDKIGLNTINFVIDMFSELEQALPNKKKRLTNLKKTVSPIYSVSNIFK